MFNYSIFFGFVNLFLSLCTAVAVKARSFAACSSGRTSAFITDQDMPSISGDPSAKFNCPSLVIEHFQPVLILGIVRLVLNIEFRLDVKSALFDVNIFSGSALN